MLKNAYSLAKIGADTAENEPRLLFSPLPLSDADGPLGPPGASLYAYAYMPAYAYMQRNRSRAVRASERAK